MSRVPVIEPSFDDIRNAVISTGGIVPTENYGFDELVSQAEEIEWFDPTYLDGASSKSDIKSLGQFRGYPRHRWGNQVQSGSFQKQCSGDGTGTWHIYTVPVDTYFSFKDQDEANDLAVADVEANGQSYANTIPEGYCTWLNDYQSGYYTKEGCGYKGIGSTIEHSIAAGVISSTESKADANDRAKEQLDTEGQSAVNATGFCTWYSEARADNFQKTDCEEGQSGSYVWVSAAEDQFYSTAGLDDANTIRNAWMQEEANATGTCAFPLPTPNLILDFHTRDNILTYSWGSYGDTNNPDYPSVDIEYSYEVLVGTGVRDWYTFENSGRKWLYFEIWEDSVIKIKARFHNAVSGEYSDYAEIVLSYYDANIE